ncbi:MAG: glycosyltransferase family 4 protein [Patescibacteria group bacterium]|nr:glycosyltransferase family 4 protein [Patescibacteria group bacterium]
MKILMVSSYLPFPLFSGGNIRLYNLLKLLSKKHKITLICEKRQNQTERDIEEVEKFCEKVITVERKKQWSVKNILKTGFSLNPFLITGHKSDEMTQSIKNELAQNKFDLIHAETFYVMQNLPDVSIPVVLVEHNIEYLIYKRFVDNAKFFIKPLLIFDVLKLKKIEEYYWRRATKLVSVSNIEKNLMTRKDVVVVPNGVDLEKFKFQEAENKFLEKQKRILFIGDFKWMQNRDAVSFIIKEIWPEIKSKIIHSASSGQKSNEGIELWIVGRNMPQSIKNLTNDKNVIFDDNNQDKTEEIYKKSFLLLAPLRIAAGTSYKILEGMASGTAVVTTNLGVEGLDAKNNIHVLVGEDAKSLAQNATSLLTDKTLYEKLTKNARDFVEKNYAWEEIVKKLEKVYISVLN